MSNSIEGAEAWLTELGNIKIKDKKRIVTSEITPEVYACLPNFKLNVYHLETEVGTLVTAFYKSQLCFSSFTNNNLEPVIEDIKKRFPNAELSWHVWDNDSFNDEPVLKILLKGSPFEISVWKALLDVGYGKTCSYTDIAERIGHVKAVRAVANAIGRNPVGFFVPCHRVVKKDGSIGGFSSQGGVELKKRLLQIEVNNK